MSGRDKAGAETEVEASGPAAPASAPGRSTHAASEGVQGDGLPYRQRSLFEGSLNRDLSGVRVHTDDAAAGKADANNARAYAVGQDIHFAKGEYKPGTREGDQLLAHEVAHTAQQDGAKPAGGELKTTTPGDGAEKNADAAASAMVDGKPAEVSSEPVAIARKAKNEDVGPPESKAPGVPATDGSAPDGKVADGAPKKAGSEDIGELTAQRVGMEEEEGGEAIGPPQNLEQGKNELAAKSQGMPPEGGAEELKGGTPKVEGAGGGGGDDAPMSDELSVSIAAAQADAREASAQATAEANAYKGEMKERRDRFENEQNAVTLEQLKAMPAADKRSTLLEMGYDKKSVKKMKDAELDGVISGKVESETRKSKILGMDPEELAGLSAAQKMNFLQDLGIERKDLDKIGAQKAAKVFDDVMRVAHVPGQHKVKVQVKGGLLGKSWELNVKVDAEGSPNIEAKAKGGFLSKLWGWVKMALPVIAVLLVPLTAGASLVALSVYQTVTAIAAGDWLGAIIGGAGALVGLGATVGALKSGVQIGAKTAANAFGKLADVATKVKNVAMAAKTTMAAAKAKSPGGVLGALSGGAAAFADFASGAAQKFGDTMRRWSERLEKWSQVASGGEKVIAGIKTGDPAGAIAGAFDAAAAIASKPEKKEDGKVVETSKKATEFQKYSRIAGYASAGQRAAKSQPPDYGAVVDAAMGIAGELKTSKKLESATKITSAASRLTRAIQTKNPGELAAAALGLAEAIQLAKIEDSDDPAEGKLSPEDEREKITQRYAKAASMVKFASAALAAASAKPRPNYIAALDAGAQLIADLTDNKKLDAAAVVTLRLDAWTAAVRSKDEKAIIAAGVAFGESINGMKDVIVAERNEAKQAAQAKLTAADTLGDDGGSLPSVQFGNGLTELPGTVVASLPGPDGELTPSVTTSEELTGIVLGSPRSPTPGSNYEVVPGDTLSGIAQRFKTSVSTLRSGNPQLVNDKVYLGQKIFVPGADVKLTPSVDVKTDFKGPAATEGGEPPLTTDVNVDVEGKLISKGAKDLIKVTKALGKLGGWSEPMMALIASISTSVSTYEDCLGKNDTKSEKFKAAVQAIEQAADTAMWADAIVKRLAGFKDDFGDLIDQDSSNQAVNAVAVFARSLKGVSAIVGLSSTVTGVLENFEKLASSDPVVKVNAANSILKTAAGLPKELAYLGEIAKFWAPGAVESIVGALATVRGSLTRFGGKVQTELMSKVFTPVLEQVGKTKGAAGAAKLAQAIAAEVGTWAGGAFARATTAAAMRTAAGTLVASLGTVTGVVLSAPAQFALAYYTFLYDFLPEVYFGARDGSSVMLTPYLYGKMIHLMKADVRAKGISNSADARDAIDYFYGAMLTNWRPDLRSGWASFAVAQLAAQGRWYSRHAINADQLQRSTGLVDQVDAARRLQNIAVDYINQAFKQEFKFDAPV